MGRRELKACLRHEVDAWAGRSYDALLEKLGDVVVYEGAFDGTEYNVEVLLIENRPEYVHVSISVDDGKLLRQMVPICGSFLVYADGRVER